MATRSRAAAARAGGGGGVPAAGQTVADRRLLRSRYLAVKNSISDARDEIGKTNSDKFHEIFTEVENLYESVERPREQVSDAEALLDIANTLVASVRSQSIDGITPSDFVSALLKNFGQQRVANVDGHQDMLCSLRWGEVGSAFTHLFMSAPGCSTMVGPMNMEVKQRKVTVHTRNQRRPTQHTRPEELAESTEEEKTDTDRNMSTMFEILRTNKSVRLENLIFNRLSFAQTVENIFALSFLVKDGRVEIDVNDTGHHIVSPRNAPESSAISSGEVSCNQFVFRFDYKDWKLMKALVADGEELMPHRSQPACYAAGTGDAEEARRTPIRKLSRSRGFVVQDDIVEETPEFKVSRSQKRKLLF